MKKTVLALTILFSSSAVAQNFKGTWRGNLDFIRLDYDNSVPAPFEQDETYQNPKDYYQTRTVYINQIGKDFWQLKEDGYWYQNYNASKVKNGFRITRTFRDYYYEPVFSECMTFSKYAFTNLKNNRATVKLTQEMYCTTEGLDGAYHEYAELKGTMKRIRK